MKNPQVEWGVGNPSVHPSGAAGSFGTNIWHQRLQFVLRQLLMYAPVCTMVGMKCQ
jgi:hypothetical protein